MNATFLRYAIVSVVIFASLAAGAASRVGLLATYPHSEPTSAMHKAAPFETTGMVRMLVRTADGDTAPLEALGVEITCRIGNIVCCRVPRGSVGKLNHQKGVVSADRCLLRRTMTDLARKTARVDLVHSGDGLPNPYTGKGVVFGIFDEGFEPHNINFIDPATGRTRFSRIWHFTQKDDEGDESRASDLADPGEELDYIETAYLAEAEIDTFLFDTDEDSHATHVTGIGAGGFRSNGFQNYGMAPETEIAAGCGLLYDDTILIGVKRIIDYAESVGRPCAINLSLGSNLGHHDGTGLFVEALDELAKRAVICIAAGNEGWKAVSVRKTLTADDPQIRTFFYTKPTLTQLTPSILGYGVAEIIGPDEQPFGIKLSLADTTTGEEICSWSPGDEDWYVVGGTDSEADTNHELFETVFTSDSFIAAAQGICPDNGRFYSYVIPVLVLRPDVAQTDVRLAIEVTGREGAFYELYNNDRECVFGGMSLPGWDNSDEFGSISDMACGFNTLCVGAYVNRTFDNHYGPVGQVAAFSSYGLLSDGRELPHICAPGQNVLASYSTHYVEGANYDPSFAIQNITKVDGKNYYWGFMTGTSMATPVVTGIAALWLEANPSLTVEEVRDIAMKTAIRDDFVSRHPIQTHWGAGKIDAYAGLCEVISATGVGSVRTDNPLLAARCLGGRDYEVVTTLDGPTAVALVDMSGRTVAAFAVADGRFSLDGIAPGLYLLNLTNSRASTSQKLILR